MKREQRKPAAIDRRCGTVKWWDDKKGFGFITDDDGRDWFVHFRQLPNRKALGARLETGERVSFSIAASAKGPMCANVEFI